ncbi:MAG: hypothetical protein ACO1O1_04800 [Adhaeribacter sp.]
MISVVPKNIRLLLCLILAGTWPVSILAKQGISSNPEGFSRINASLRPCPAAAPFLLKEADEQAQVLQACLNLPALQPYYPTNKKGEPEKLYVLQHGVSFSPDMEVKVAGKSLVFVDKAGLAKEEPPVYLLFYEFALSGNTARVEFVLNYDQTSSLKKMLVVSLDLQKTSGTWTVVQQKTKQQES